MTNIFIKNSITETFVLKAIKAEQTRFYQLSLMGQSQGQPETIKCPAVDNTFRFRRFWIGESYLPNDIVSFLTEGSRIEK